MDIVRSPYAHAKIKKISTEKALKVPGVLAVITGETLAQYKLHWMPTLMSDTQMVLPTDRVMYQAQEVAAVIATDRYAAADGVEPSRSSTSRCPWSSTPSRRSSRARPCSAPTNRARRTTGSSTGRWETARRPTPR
jgi:CO/xanthine dehydrogenase Mo-binding subunit